MAGLSVCFPVGSEAADTRTASLNASLPLGLLELPNGSASPVLSAQLGSWVLQTRFSSVWEISITGPREEGGVMTLSARLLGRLSRERRCLRASQQ